MFYCKEGSFFQTAVLVGIAINYNLWTLFIITLLLRIAGLTNSQIASSVFTLGTAAVLPFYTLMVLAPKAELVCILCLGLRIYSFNL